MVPVMPAALAEIVTADGDARSEAIVALLTGAKLLHIFEAIGACLVAESGPSALVSAVEAAIVDDSEVIPASKAEFARASALALSDAAAAFKAGLTG